jgi:hypothetical protein
LRGESMLEPAMRVKRMLERYHQTNK